MFCLRPKEYCRLMNFGSFKYLNTLIFGSFSFYNVKCKYNKTCVKCKPIVTNITFHQVNYICN